jgi:hypothetical protein
MESFRCLRPAVTKIKWVNLLTYLAVLLFAVAAALFCIVFIEPSLPESKQKSLGIIYLFCLFGGALLSSWISLQRWFWKKRK